MITISKIPEKEEIFEEILKSNEIRKILLNYSNLEKETKRNKIFKKLTICCQQKIEEFIKASSLGYTLLKKLSIDTERLGIVIRFDIEDRNWKEYLNISNFVELFTNFSYFKITYYYRNDSGRKLDFYQLLIYSKYATTSLNTVESSLIFDDNSKIFIELMKQISINIIDLKYNSI